MLEVWFEGGEVLACNRVHGRLAKGKNSPMNYVRAGIVVSMHSIAASKIAKSSWSCAELG